MRFLYIFLLGCFLDQQINAQTLLQGSVTTTGNTPIPFASLAVLNSASGTVSSTDGTYQLALPPGSYQLQVSALGYANQIKTVVLADQVQELNFRLELATVNLDQAVVTASKREESLLLVPAAVSVLGAEKIERTRTVGLGNLTALVPNYLYQELGVGFQQIQAIRGIQVFSENPAVATYIDDVNNLDILANGFQFTDIERIEVLRGPQGTLFGRNAMGGVVNIITKRPTNQTSGFAELGVGNLALQRHALSVKTPLVKDRLFFGISRLYQSREGYWTNDTTGTGAPNGAVNGAKVGGEKNMYDNLFLQFLPSARFSALLNLKTQRDWSNSSGFFVSQPDAELALEQPDKIYLRRIGEHERNILNASLTLKHYGQRNTFTSISTWQSIGLSFADIDFPGFYHSFSDQKIGEKLPPQQVFTQELRLNGSNATHNLRYTLGGFGFTQVGYEPSTNLAFELAPDAYAIFRNKSNNFGLAAYGELTLQLNPKLAATAGIRYDYEDRESTFNGFGDATFAGGIFTQLAPDTTLGDEYAAFSPKIALSYALREQTNLYLSYTRGFRAGGVNAQKLPAGVPQKFDPEYSNNFELGFKTRAWENRLSLNAAAFLIQWQDLQFFNLVAPFTYARENVGDAQSAGIELELAVVVAKGLQLEGSLGVARATYREIALTRVNFATGEEIRVEVSDNQLANTPRHTLYLGAQYRWPLATNWQLALHGELRSIGEFYTDIQNSLRQPNYALVNTNVELSYQKISLALWTQNLFNQAYLGFGSPDTSFGGSVRTAAPRTFGITLKARF